jgi:hypothetical protein
MSQLQPINSEEIANNSAPIPSKRENMLVNLGCNLLLPILILNKGERWIGNWLGGFVGNVTLAILLLALAFPVIYFFYDLINRRRYNLFSILGFTSVLLTGGIGLLSLPTFWFAVKEAAIPFFFGLAVILSLKTPYPLVRTFLYNPDIIAIDKINERLTGQEHVLAFNRLLLRCTWILAGSFFLSTLLNFTLARMMVVSPGGTEAFNNEVGRFMIWSWPVIAVPAMLFMFLAMFLLFRGIHQLTGLRLEDLLIDHKKQAPNT